MHMNNLIPEIISDVLVISMNRPQNLSLFNCNSCLTFHTSVIAVIIFHFEVPVNVKLGRPHD
jgi:hypothetical protein